MFITTLLNHPLGRGPALMASAEVPDLHHFRGSFGAKEVIPLYRDAAATEPNILPGLIEVLGRAYGRAVSAEDFAAYVYGVMSHAGYTSKFWDELETCEVRVPLTRDRGLFDEAVSIGRRLIWVHTYGERFVPPGTTTGIAALPAGAARCTRAVSDQPDDYPERFQYDAGTRTLHVGDGQFAPVTAEVYEFEVSGLKVVQSWLSYRMRERGGRRSSPLDDIHPRRWTADFTSELLALLHILEATIAELPQQRELLDRIVAGATIAAVELPSVPQPMRQPPRPAGEEDLFGNGGADDPEE